ncbi:hypothetical protein [Ectobacillus panaciterrae]|uniref:hypothetical protein n=1 Tax=Ectobacillus panaciterrae TaxID=363872 RepID=UPI000422AE21|nr:hypothetical protein [Ectobacillus panaciterrae]
MDIIKTQQWINDYLDLYLYAGSIGDKSWQQEIIGKLRNFSHKTQEQALKPSVGLNKV